MNIKLLFTLLLVCVLTLFSGAQTVINSTVIPPIGSSTVFIKSNSFKLFSVGASGANVTWDFTAIDTAAGYYIQKAAKADTTLFYVNFPSIVNYAIQYTDIFGQPDYIYNKLDTSVLEKYGTLNEIYTNPQKLMAFPFAFGNQFNDIFHTTDSTFYGNTSVSADAFGILKLPTGLFSNVLRVKSIDRYREITDRDAFGKPIDSLMYEGDHYRWYSPGYIGPLLEYSKLVTYYNVGATRINVDTTAHLYLSNYRNTVNAVDEINNFSLSCFPNPVSSVLNILSQSELQLIEVYDLSGRLCNSISASGNKASISFENLAPGLYQCRLINAENQVRFFKIMHN